MKALIVDDEPLARLELRRLLAAFAWIQVVGEAGNIDEARAQIETLAPDLAFLDVQMQGGTGFDLLAQLGRPPRIVFTTAYDHYAVKAFEVSALDYLLKPIEPERLAAALAKLRTAMSNQAASGDLPLQQLFIHDGPRCRFLPMREVSLFVAEGNYVRLHWGNERPVLGRSLAAVEEKLDAKTFLREPAADRESGFRSECPAWIGWPLARHVARWIRCRNFQTSGAAVPRQDDRLESCLLRRQKRFFLL
jgi:two-component system LytT family response regulator